MQALFERLSAQGFRLLGIASRAEPPDQATCVLADEKGLAFAGFAVFLDPPKVSARAALAELAAAGLAVKILTGDNERVAQHLWQNSASIWERWSPERNWQYSPTRR